MVGLILMDSALIITSIMLLIMCTPLGIWMLTDVNKNAPLLETDPAQFIRKYRENIQKKIDERVGMEQKRLN